LIEGGGPRPDLAKGNRARAARLLRIRRALLYAHMKQLGIADDYARA